MKASQQAIERGVKDCVFIDYKRRSGHFDVTTVASIKEITEKVNPPGGGSITVETSFDMMMIDSFEKVLQKLNNTHTAKEVSSPKVEFLIVNLSKESTSAPWRN